MPDFIEVDFDLQPFVTQSQQCTENITNYLWIFKTYTRKLKRFFYLCVLCFWSGRDKNFAVGACNLLSIIV